MRSSSMICSGVVPVGAVDNGRTIGSDEELATKANHLHEFEKLVLCEDIADLVPFCVALRWR